MGEQKFETIQDDPETSNGYSQRYFPVLPWYSAPDKPFPRRKYKCLRCQEIQKQSTNMEVQATSHFEKKIQEIHSPIPSEKLSSKEALEDKKDSENRISVSEEVSTSNKLPTSNDRPTPKSWSDLLKGSGSSYTTVQTSQSSFSISNETIQNNLSQVLNDIKLNVETKPTVLFQPRGLINTGNVCFMNVILQVLVFCPPFYNLLNEIGKKMTHRFDNDTSLTNALISFIREFSVISRPLLNGENHAKKDIQEEFGEPFIPEYVYIAMRGNKLFDSMRRGHQEDAEEFLGLLLEALHEEFVHEMNSDTAIHGVDAYGHTNHTNSSSTNSSNPSRDKNENEWVEVGLKQKTSIMRSATVTESPLTPIFTGNFRSILRVPGMKPSITLEPYRSLQLDIEPLHIGSIEEALQNITQPEILQGDWHSSLGEQLKATKQVFIETLPQVLILHLKRFVYDNVGGTQKSHKNVYYPLQFEIPPTVMSPHRRSDKNVKFILFAVVYHHGMSASGGHYTVDLLRQDMHSWIRIDDTHISHILPEHVVPSSSESPNRFAYLLFYLRP